MAGFLIGRIENGAGTGVRLRKPATVDGGAS